MSDYLAPELEEPERGLDEIEIVDAVGFAEVDEPGIDSLLGTSDDNLIPVGADVMLYGDGGAGKTTLTVDLACHLATGTPWLGIGVSRPRTVLLIENEGPRPLFRRKLRRKLEGWPWERPERVLIWTSPWGGFSFADTEGRAQLARLISDHEVDLVIAGPLTQLGMDEAGTLQDVRRFHSLTTQVRERSLRPVSFLLIHHESKAGRVSGAWEGVGDTLLQLQATGRHAVRVFVQKARWSAAHHGKTLRLAWAEGDSFEVEDDPAVGRAEDVWDRMLDFVLAHGGTTWGPVQKHLGGTHDYNRRRRDSALEGGELVNLGDPKTMRLWHRDDPTRPLAIDELAGGASDESTRFPTLDARGASANSTHPTTHAVDPRGEGEGEGASARRPYKVDAPSPPHLSPDSEGDPYDW